MDEVAMVASLACPYSPPGRSITVPIMAALLTLGLAGLLFMGKAAPRPSLIPGHEVIAKVHFSGEGDWWSCPFLARGV